MFKRVMWMGIGATAGVGASVWANRQVKRTVARLAPEAVAQDIRERFGRLRQDVTEALADGRQAMHEREAELEAKAGTRGRRPPGHGPTIEARAIDLAPPPLPGPGTTPTHRR